MKCPKCGKDNLAGKLLCFECGARLPRPVGPGQQRGKKKGSKKGSKSLYGLFLIIPALLLGTVLYLILQKPEIEPLNVSPKAARRLEAKLKKIGRATSAGKPVKVKITQEELNSSAVERLGKTNIKLDDVQVRLEGGKLKSVGIIRVKGKSLYISLSGKVSLRDGKLILKPETMKIGKLPVPAVKRTIGWVKKGEGDLVLLALPAGVKSVRVEGGKLIVKAEPSKQLKEKKPLPRKKKALTPEELEELKRSEAENEASSWLQVGDNFVNVKRYDSAVDYYRKVISKYPESEQAKKARKRIEEVMAELESME